MTWTATPILIGTDKNNQPQATVAFTSDDPSDKPLTLTNQGVDFGKQQCNDWVWRVLNSLNIASTTLPSLKSIPLNVPFVPDKPADIVP